jgi:hypothetical protein
MRLNGELSHSQVTLISRPGSGSGPNPNFGLKLGLLLNKPKAWAQTGLGLGVGPRARAWAYLVKARAWPEPDIYSPSPARARSFLARPSPTVISLDLYGSFEQVFFTFPCMMSRMVTAAWLLSTGFSRVVILTRLYAGLASKGGGGVRWYGWETRVKKSEKRIS